jgi:hypothetical protein
MQSWLVLQFEVYCQHSKKRLVVIIQILQHWPSNWLAWILNTNIQDIINLRKLQMLVLTLIQSSKKLVVKVKVRMKPMKLLPLIGLGSM